MFVILLWETEMPTKEKTGYEIKGWIPLMQVSSVKDFLTIALSLLTCELKSMDMHDIYIFVNLQTSGTTKRVES